MQRLIYNPGLDLDWVVTSPSLIVSSQEALHPLDISPVDPEALRRHLKEVKSYRVGHYFEALVHFWLKEVRRVEIVEYQKQIFHEQQTIGEIDFLFRDENGRLTHLETAVKFYLHHPTQVVKRSHFIGPNSADTFQRKMSKLFDHQLQLGRSHYSGIESTEAFVKGRIFYHPKASLPADQPPRLSSDHLRSKWIYAKEIDWVNEFAEDQRYLILHKPNWLSPIFFDEFSVEVMSKLQLKLHSIEHFKDSIRPLLVSVLRPGDQGYQESERFFIVSNQWPTAK